jgi:hypothetical protein
VSSSTSRSAWTAREGCGRSATPPRSGEKCRLVSLQVQSYTSDTPVCGQIRHRIRARFSDGAIRTGWVQSAPGWPAGAAGEPEVRWEGANNDRLV